MRKSNAVVRMISFLVEEKRNTLAQIEGMIEEFEATISKLDLELTAEEQRTRVSDERDPAYSLLARNLRLRRKNLQISLEDLGGRLAGAREELEVAEEEHKRQAAKMTSEEAVAA